MGVAGKGELGYKSLKELIELLEDGLFINFIQSFALSE